MDIDFKEEKERLVKKEKSRLNRIFKNIDEDKKRTVEGLIENAAYMRVSLNEMKQDIDALGYTEKFSQGDQAPYDRKRPIVDIFNSMNAQYPKVVKMLTDLLPKVQAKTAEVDVFDEFAEGREDV